MCREQQAPAMLTGCLLHSGMMVGLAAANPTPPRVLIFSLGDDYGFVRKAPFYHCIRMVLISLAKERPVVTARSARHNPVHISLINAHTGRTTWDIHTAHTYMPTRRRGHPH